MPVCGIFGKVIIFATLKHKEMEKDLIQCLAAIGGMVIGSAIGLGIYFLIDWLQWRRDKKIIDRLLEEDKKHNRL